MGVTRIRCAQILRKFGAPPKIRRFSFVKRAAAGHREFVTPLIYWTFPASRARPHTLARFLRGDARGSLFVPLQTMTERRESGSLSQYRSLRNPRRNNHEACNHRSISGRRLHRPEHYGSKRGRMRSRCLPGRLRRSPWCCRRTSGCPSCRRRTATGRSPPQSLLMVVRRVFPRTSCRARSRMSSASS